MTRRTLSLFAFVVFASFAAPASAEWPSWISASAFESAEASSDESALWTIRGQSDPFYAPPAGGAVGQPVPVVGQTFGDQTFGGQPGEVVSQAPLGSDPFLAGQFAPPPASYDPFGQQGTYGINGPQPYRFGWKEKVEFALTPKSSTTPNVGAVSWNEFNYIKEYNAPSPTGGVWSFAPQLNARWLEGPQGGIGPPARPDISGDLWRFGLGLKYTTPSYGGGPTFEFGFNPAFATDFEKSISGDAWQFDGHIASFWRVSPTWMWVLGVMYWDRDDDFVLPYAGAVWTPSDYFEARLLFPKARLEWFLGTPIGVPMWTYASAEYHVESYEVRTGATRSVLQTEDWRIMGGVRWEAGWVETYLEAGIVFDREWTVAGATPSNSDIDSAFIGRFGIKF